MGAPISTRTWRCFRLPTGEWTILAMRNDIPVLHNDMDEDYDDTDISSAPEMT